MKKTTYKITIYCFLSIFSLLALEYAVANQKINKGSQNTDIEIIRNRLMSELMEPEVDNARVELLLKTKKKDGTWPDINYKDVSRTAFEHQRHVGNLVLLGRAYTKPGSDFYKSPKVKQAIDSSLDFWIKHDFIADNWHSNEIGTPQQWARFLFLMGSELTDLQVKEVVRMAKRANLQAWGARPGGDLIKIAGIMAEVALFENDEVALGKAVAAMAGQIQITSGRGLKPDYSFHHRTDRVTSTLSYGSGYASSFAEWAPRLSGTKFQFPEEKLVILTDFFLEGMVPMMVNGHYPDPGAMNRAMASPSAIRPHNAGLPISLLKASSYREEDLKNIISIRKGEKKPDIRESHFLWHSEYFSHQRPHYFASVRMHSSRTYNMEAPHNQQSLKHHHFADGANFISRTGEEYRDIFPVWDWQKIPGTTVVQKPSLPGPGHIVKQGLKDFVGGVTDSTFGVAVFDFKSPHDPLEAKKSWFFFEKEIICLGTGISSNSEHPVATTLNQSILNGDVSLKDDNKESMISKGKHDLPEVSWIHHDKIAYIFPRPTAVQLENRPVSGTWRSITEHSWAESSEELQKEIFSLWLDHGPAPEQASYEYIVVPGIEVSDIQPYREKSDIKVLSNTPTIQAVQNNDLNISQIVFYEKSQIEIAGGINIIMNSPGLAMVYTSGNEISKIVVSDPTRKLSSLHIRVSTRFEGSGRNWKAAWSQKDGYCDVYIKLPNSAFAGSSVVIDRHLQNYTDSQVSADPSLARFTLSKSEAETKGKYFIGQKYGGGIVFGLMKQESMG